MAKINSRALINVGTELIIDEENRTYELIEAGNLNAKDGVTIQALYSKFVDLWSTEQYQDSPFPMNALDALSGQYQIGIDAGGNANGWRPKNQDTRDMQRDGGSDEYNAAGELIRINTGIVGLGSINTGAQAYYQLEPDGEPINFTFTDMPNIGVQVFGDVDGGFIDTRSFFKSFVREQGKRYSSSVLADTGATGTGSFKVNMLLSNEDDLKITDDDSQMLIEPYNNINVTYHQTNQTRQIGGVDYDYSIIVDGNGATLEEIYTKLQYLLRQDYDIDSGLSGVTGKTAELLAGFVGDTLHTATGVFIDNILDVDSNRIKFKDATGVERENPFEAAGTLEFNSIMVQPGSRYRLMYTDGAGDADYGSSGAVTVNDASGNPITGEITSGAISFSYDYDNDSEGGLDAATDKPVTLIGIAPNFSKFAVAEGLLEKSKTMKLGLVAEVDRAYL
jgi:hypothetical protein